jgi:hypothetical protein
MYRTYIIFLHSKLGFVKSELLQLDSLQNSNWLIFKIYLNTEKSLFCHFCYSKSTPDMSLNPVGLVREIYKLSRTFWFAKFGFVEFELFRFEVGSSIGFETKELNWIWISGPRGKTKRPKQTKQTGPAQLALTTPRAAWHGVPRVSGLLHRIGIHLPKPCDQTLIRRSTVVVADGGGDLLRRRGRGSEGAVGRRRSRERGEAMLSTTRRRLVAVSRLGAAWIGDGDLRAPATPSSQFELLRRGGVELDGGEGSVKRGEQLVWREGELRGAIYSGRWWPWCAVEVRSWRWLSKARRGNLGGA